jgi:Fe2+ or Zn2+ uptake regulation protein
MTMSAIDPSGREMALRRLAAAEERVARARVRIARQREIVAKLESAGRDPADARKLLDALSAGLADCEQGLATLLNQLTRCGWQLGER